MGRLSAYLLGMLLVVPPVSAQNPAAELRQRAYELQKQGIAEAETMNWPAAIAHFHSAVMLEKDGYGNARLHAWLQIAARLEAQQPVSDLPEYIRSLKRRAFDDVDKALISTADALALDLETIHLEAKKWSGRNLTGSERQLPDSLRSALFNLALAQDKAGGRSILAMVWYHGYLATHPEAESEALVRRRIDVLHRNANDMIRMLHEKAKDIAAYNHSVNVQIRNLTQAPGSTFQDTLTDGSLGPEMVVIPPGTYTMGYIHGVGVGINPDRPFMVHEVVIPKPFAIGKFEVTVQEYFKFAQATGRAMPAGQGGDQYPVAGVRWEDADAYARWLSHETGEKYRLPSEAEWEYVARAGTQTKFWWGNEASHEHANYGAGFAGPTPFPFGVVQGRDQWEYTSPVGSFPANPFGVHDTSGNVWEYVADCYRYNYKEVPPDAGPYVKENCGAYVMRGGSWGYNDTFISSASRAKVFFEVNLFLAPGFRVAKDID